eukprot:SAG31_NODE_1123_length_9787_cov_5.258877_9_plen_489_part_00
MTTQRTPPLPSLLPLLPLLLLLLLLQALLIRGWPGQPQPQAAMLQQTDGSLSRALKFALDLPLTTAEEDSVVDRIFAEAVESTDPRRSEKTSRSGFRELVARVADRYGGVPSNAAAAEVVALLAPREIDAGDLVNALSRNDFREAASLLAEFSGPDVKSITVDGQSAVAYVLQQQAAVPILARTGDAIECAYTLCAKGIGHMAPMEVDNHLQPLVLAAQFRHAELCDCIRQRQQEQDLIQDVKIAHQALLGLLTYSKNRGWGVAVARSLLLVPAGGGSSKAFQTDALQAALTISAPVRCIRVLAYQLTCIRIQRASLYLLPLVDQLRRLFDSMRFVSEPSKSYVRTVEVEQALEAWALPTAIALLRNIGNSTYSLRFSDCVISTKQRCSSCRDALGRTTLHLATLAGWPSMIALQQTNFLTNASQSCMVDDNQSCSAASSNQTHYLPNTLALAVDVFGRTALHFAQMRGGNLAAAVINATAPDTLPGP